MIVFLLSHGQATIERGFSVNQEVQEVNMEELSLISQRMVYDELSSTNVKVHQYQLTTDLIKRCNQSSKHNKAYLAERKDTVLSEEKSRKRKLVNEEIAAVKKKKQELESCVEVLEKDADQLSIEAEKAMSWELVAKANAFRASAVEKRSTIAELATAVINLENSKAALK